MIHKIRAELLFSRGQNLAKQGLFEESVQSFNKALSFKPSYSGIYLHKALSLSKLNEYPAARDSIKTAIEMNPKNPAFYLFMGIVHYDHKNYDEAFIAFEDTLKLCPDNYLALCYKNLIFLIRGERLDEAGNILRQHVKHANHDFQSRVLEFCETVCFQNSKPGKAFDIFHDLDSQTSKRPSSDILASFSLALMPFIYDLLYFSNPVKKSAYKHYNKAVRAQLIGEFDEAIKEYREALDIYSEISEAVDKLIELYWDRKDYHASLKVIESLPVYDKISTIISNFRSAGKEGKDIERYAIQQSSLFFVLAYSDYQTGDYDSALEIFEMIAKDGHNNPLVFYYLALCYISKNDNAEARIAFQLSLKYLLDQRVLSNRLEKTIQLLDKSRSAKHA
jgi:tetratricopeptide (TPR) repeat protein